MPIRKTSLIEDAISSIEETHKGVGKTLVACAVAVMAQRCVMLISPAGCGKSTIASSMADLFTSNIRLGSITNAGLGKEAERLSGFKGMVYVDDVGEVGNSYLRKVLITTLSGLTYSHVIRKDTGLFHFEIQNFQGGTMMGVQPIMLRNTIRSTEWEANIADKTMRYYHIHRPIKPTLSVPKLALPVVTQAQALFDERDTKAWRELLRLGLTQWSTARVREHLIAMIKVVAAINGRREATDDDMIDLLYLLRPMKVERWIVQKKGWEDGRSLATELLHALVAFATYGEIRLDTIVQDYKVSTSTAYNLIQSLDEYIRLRQKSPAIYWPSDTMKEVMNDIGEGGTL